MLFSHIQGMGDGLMSQAVYRCRPPVYGGTFMERLLCASQV